MWLFNIFQSWPDCVWGSLVLGLSNHIFVQTTAMEGFIPDTDVFSWEEATFKSIKTKNMCCNKDKHLVTTVITNVLILLPRLSLLD